MFFKTLKSEIKKQLNNTIYKNELFKRYKHNFRERIIMNWAQAPFIQSLKFMIFFVILAFLFYQLKELNYNLLPFPLTIEHWKNIVELNTWIFSGQITIIALIFPLVIGFVGVLMKDDTANKSLWRIYSRYSGFLLVGYSSLLLIVLMSILKYFTPFIDKNELLEISFALSFGLWFIFNLYLVGWLIYSTFEFIKIEKRNTIILKYTTNIIIIKEINKRLFSLIPTVENAQRLNLLTKRFSKKKLELSSFTWNDESKFVVKKKFIKDKYLININFTLISLVIKSILLRNTCFLTKNGTKLILPSISSNYPYSQYELAKMNNLPFSLLERVLLKRAYSFSYKGLFEDDDVKNIVNSFFNNIENYIKDGNSRLFEDASDMLRKFMQVIFGITTFINDEGKLDNWLLLPDNTIFSGTLLNEIIREFYSLNEVVIDKTRESDKYFRNFCYFYQYTFHENEINKVHPKIQKSLMEVHYNLWVELISNNFLKNEKRFNDLCKTYIGGWESWANKREREVNNWDIAKHSSLNLINSLLISNNFLHAALKYKNDNATLWGVNILNYWYENYFGLSNGNYQYLWRSDILSFNIFNKFDNEKNNILKFILNGQVFENKDIQNLYEILNRNIWIESRIINSAYILNKDTTSITDIDRQIVFGLLNGDRLSPGKTPRMDFSDSHNMVQKILETYILNNSAFNRITGQGLAYILTEDFDRIYEDTRISGRVYSGGGRSGISRLTDSVIILLVANSTTSIIVSNDIYDFIFNKSIFEQRNIDDLKRELKELLEVTDNIKDKVRKLLDKDDIDDLVENYTKSINEIIKKIEEQNNAELREAEISETQIKRLQKYCSLTAFSKENLKTPLFLFKEVEYSEILEEKDDYAYLINLNNVDKRILLDAEVNRSINEDDFYSTMLDKQVKIKIFRDLFKIVESGSLVEQNFIRVKDLVMNIIRDSQNFKNSIILIGESEVLSFLNRLRWDKQEEILFDIEFKQTNEANYVCHINNIPVYSITYFDINYCLLIDSNIFEKVIIKQFDKDIYVDLDYKENEDNIEKGLLKISFYIKTIFSKNLRSYKYTFNSNVENDNFLLFGI